MSKFSVSLFVKAKTDILNILQVSRRQNSVFR
ncbi:hypothetical protein RDI58_013648 [Solanum bulbocastanum]|uniref:Uncharacterized protein n=1 Tax=Solanum bulbocastanum TaxID=147425 RepID=A0AAN8TS69_SOLBU